MADQQFHAAPVEDARIYLAAERTLLAWIRTGLSLMGFGFVVARFGLFLRELAVVRGMEVPPPAAGRSVSMWIGLVLVVLGVLVNLLAAIDHGRVVRSLRRGDTHPATKSAMGVALGVVLAVLGIAMALYLLGAAK